MSRRALVPTVLTLVFAVIAVSAAGWILRRDAERSGQLETALTSTATHPDRAGTEKQPDAPVAPTAFSTPQLRFAPYEPPSGETYVNGKRLAGRVGQRLATFPPRASIRELTRALVAAGGRRAELDGTVAPLLDPERRSAGEVLFVQLSGVTATTFGAMVIVRQHFEDAAGIREEVVRVMDVRLRRTDGPWSVDRIASVGGTAVQRPANVSPAEARVLDHPNIQLPDTARWDIHRGGIDDGLLVALADAADRWPIAVTVLRTGHPRYVWATDRESAHASGYAADVYAVNGRLVQRQRESRSNAERLAAALLAGGARQVGSPWNLRPGDRRSFTDRVHQDHVHLQQTPSPRPRR
ncbi:MAG: hypothetical protein ABIM89_10445 [Mycobacteriales bacterium]